MLEFELESAIQAIKEAEKAILEVYSRPFEVEIKEDKSPVTEADKKADEIIRAYLSKRFPEDGFLTEESADTPERFQKKRIWIVDPVDGTKEFVSRNGEFTTNVALAENGEIILGLINVPTKGDLYYAILGQGAFKLGKDGSLTRLHVSLRRDGLIPMRSISFFQPEEERFMKENAAHFSCEAWPTGAALKFAKLAEGTCDFFFRASSGTKEWDVAAGDLLVREAGGFVTEPSGQRFVYNRKDVYNRNGYLMGNFHQPWMIIKK